MSFTFWSSLRPLRAPDFRFMKALSVGAKRVKPCEFDFSWLSIWVSCWVSFRSRIRVVYCPPFSRMAVRFRLPEGEGAGAWAWAWALRQIVRVRRMRVRGVEAML
uniref:Uncharacterized protein n=1 Tax=Cajanus cajan TaxID=3821 RepID=A0A151SES8_CAJCA|nr:hypothetical protein KK1_024719 [Cajanus cajan]